ncbi:MAG: FKBP-type peptidyl-prolyl cis-trans isomerase [Clostridia bacterium]|nr:FKBP-type peptidyl-prolyl cis-trans isomerase [Clostridia bacterium]
MKKIISILLVSILMVTVFAGCAASKGRKIFDTVDLIDYVDICDYKNINIDKSSAEYMEIYVYFLQEDIRQTQISEENIKNAITFDSSAETVVEYGDIVNIDYTGYIGETAFENGSDKEALLLIGSGYFIDDFEEQLIGSKPGQTVDVHVTFPTDYKSADLAGKRVKFEVKINSVAKEPEELYKVYQIASKEEYVKLINTRAQREFILTYLLNNSTINEYPEDDLEILYSAVVEQYSLDYGIDLSTSAQENVLANLVEPLMKKYMIMYYIFDEQQLELLDSTLESQETTNATIAECYAVYDTVMNYLLDVVKVK